MAIAEHSPSKVYKENASVTRMSKNQLHDFASTKGLHEAQHPVKHEKRKGSIGDSY